MTVKQRKGAVDKLKRRYGEPPAKAQRFRLWLMVAVFGFLFLVVCGKLWVLHLNPYYRLTEEDRKHIGLQRFQEPRGAIVDRHNVRLATNKKVPSLWVDPRIAMNPDQVPDPDKLVRVTAAALDMAEDEVRARFSKKDSEGKLRKFMWVKRWLVGMPREEIDALVAAGHGALKVKHEPLRYYPHGDTAAHLLGFVNRVGEASEGLELTCNAFLESEPGEIWARKDVQCQLLESEKIAEKKPKEGATVQITIDTPIQHLLERVLDERIEECNAKRGMGMIMDPRTGAILALATRPAFNPNHYNKCDAEDRKNFAVIDVFEPGSVFKIVTAAAALELNLITPDTMIDCEDGAFNPYGHRIHDFHKFYEPIPFWKAFAESSNIAIIKVAAMVGEKRLEEWMHRFGFGSKTSSDFVMESAGILRPLSRWSGLSMGALPIGQEVAVTLPQLVRAFAVIANGGLLVEPYFIERAVMPSGEVLYQREPSEPLRVLSERTAATMRDLCWQVVRIGTGDDAQIAEYRVGGKTGTAQMKREDGPGYDPDRYTTVFTGFAPVSDPRLVCAVVVQEPMIRLHYGGYVCGPVFVEVMRDALIRLNVPEDPMPVETPEGETEAPVVVAAAPGGSAPANDADMAAGRVAAEDFETELAMLLEPLDGLELVHVDMDKETGEAALPDFTGLTKSQARTRLADLKIPWAPHGAGWVVAQDPPPGTPLSQVSHCSLEFAGHAPETEALAAPQKNDA